MISLESLIVCFTGSESYSDIGWNPEGCAEGWVPFRKFCYKMMTNKAPFDDARTSCQGFSNGDLVSITDDYEFNFVRSLIYRTIDEGPNPVGPAAWIGLTVYKANDGDIIYEWVDKFPFAATYWGANQPDEKAIPPEGSHACVNLELPAGYWSISGGSCSMNLNFVCKQNMENIDPGDIPDNRGEPMGCPDGWTTFSTESHHCYKAFPDKVSWYDAEEVCAAQMTGAHLISVHSETKNSQASSLFHTVATGAFWIGGKRNEAKGFDWTDQSDFSYTKWGKGEPSEEWNGKPEDCISVEPDTYWNDAYCDQTTDTHDLLGHVCQIPAQMSNCLGKA